MQESLHKRGWGDPRGLLAFTRNSTHPDLWIWIDAADHASPVNMAATMVRGQLCLEREARVAELSAGAVHVPFWGLFKLVGASVRPG